MTYPSISKTALNTIINGNAYDPYYSYKSPIDLYDIHQFTNGQPFEAYADLRKNSPIYFQNPPDWDICLLYTSPSPRDRQKARMPSSA